MYELAVFCLGLGGGGNIMQLSARNIMQLSARNIYRCPIKIIIIILQYILFLYFPLTLSRITYNIKYTNGAHDNNSPTLKIVRK